LFYINHSIISEIRQITKNRIDKSGPKNPDYQLDENELLRFFSDWKLIFYKEEGVTGDLKNGFRNQAMIISQKNKL